VYLDRLAQDDADLATRVAVISEELRRLKTNLSRLEEEQRAIEDRAQREHQLLQDKLAEAEERARTRAIHRSARKWIRDKYK
jgi:predicted nuclease with TOPRIM domain